MGLGESALLSIAGFINHHPITRSTSLASSWKYAPLALREFATPVVAVLVE